MQRRFRVAPRFYFFIIILMLALFALSFTLSQLRWQRLSAHADALEQTRAELAVRVRELGERLTYVQSDDYVERVARDELNMLMPGEVRYVSS